MYFKYPFLLLLILAVFIPFLFPKKHRGLGVSSRTLVGETSVMFWLRKVWAFLTGAVWIMVVALIVVLLARPLKDDPNFVRKEKVRKICPVADVSTSMSGEGIKRLKDILNSFVDKRRGDWQCLVAFSGRYEEDGGARVLQPLTPDVDLMHKAVNRLEAKLLGSYTAIGEGIWTTVFALRETQLRNLEKKNIGVDLVRLRQELKVGNRSYFEYLTNLIGPAENEIMVFFTDGFYNTGLHPSYGILLVEKLRIKMYIAVLKPTGSTGLSKEEAMKRLEELKNAAKRSGGDYFEAENYDEVAAFYAKVDAIEKREEIVETTRVTREVFDEFTPYLPFLVGVFILMSVSYIRIRGRKR